MGQNRWYLTSVMLVFLLMLVAVLAARWTVLARRVPLEGAQLAVAAQASTHATVQPARSQQSSHLPQPVAELPSKPNAAPRESTLNPSARLDINAATADDLVKLPQIGPKLAEAIVAYRTESGAFKTVDELLNVPGIGAGRLDAIRSLIEVR